MYFQEYLAVQALLSGIGAADLSQQAWIWMEHLVPTSYNYLAYGCNLISDIPFEQLTFGHDPTLDTITIRRCKFFPDTPLEASQMGPFAKIAPNYLSLNIDDVLEMVALNGNTLLYRPHSRAAESALQVFLLGSGLGALLIQRELLVLHGNAIKIDDYGILCAGHSGVGKSTTAAGLMQRDYQVMSDDVCAIDAHSCIIPGIPHIKLWQESADKLKVATQNLSQVRPEYSKFRIPLGTAFHAEPVRISTLYILTPHPSDTVTCETLTGNGKFMALRENTYRFPFVNGMGLSALHFRQIEMLLKQITVKRLKRPQTGFNLDQLLDVLIEDATS